MASQNVHYKAGSPPTPTSPWSVRTQEAQQEVSSKASSTAPRLNYYRTTPYPKGWGQLLESTGSPRGWKPQFGQ